MEGVVDYRPSQGEVEVLKLEPSNSSIRAVEAYAPRQVKICLTPVSKGTLVTVLTQEWQGQVKIDTRVMALRLDGITRTDWAVGPQDALSAVVVALAAYLEA